MDLIIIYAEVYLYKLIIDNENHDDLFPATTRTFLY
jgi:hypothetical protein